MRLTILPVNIFVPLANEVFEVISVFVCCRIVELNTIITDGFPFETRIWLI